MLTNNQNISPHQKKFSVNVDSKLVILTLNSEKVRIYLFMIKAMRRLKELRDKMLKELGGIYPKQECLNMVNWLFLSVAGIEKKEFILEPGRLVEENIKAEILEKLGELMAHKPIQYVTGTAYFHDLELNVNPSVLIPRPETEELVKWVADDHKDEGGLRILDIGTGSGCIILTLGRLLRDPHLTAVDISEKAIGTASGNAGKYDIRVDFKIVDILEKNDLAELGTYDLVISNPPYVRESEKSGMMTNVLNYEPPAALFVPDSDPLLFYRAIARFSKQHLSENGELYLEINESFGKELVFLLKREGFSEIILKKDMQGKDRMVRCSPNH
jgi:release factor glutamine methyltransferase